MTYYPRVTMDADAAMRLYRRERKKSETRNRPRVEAERRRLEQLAAQLANEVKEAGKGGRPRKAPSEKKPPAVRAVTTKPLHRCEGKYSPACLGTIPARSKTKICDACRCAIPCLRCGKPLTPGRSGTRHSHCYRLDRAGVPVGQEPVHVSKRQQAVHGTRARYKQGCTCHRCVATEAAFLEGVTKKRAKVAA